MNNNIKIFISCHKPSYFIKEKLFIPIQVGSALSKSHFENMICDDKGDNISDLNPKFCELTAQYYAWKNEDAEYYGFFHYRRYLNFNESSDFKQDCWGNIVDNVLSEASKSDYGLFDNTVKDLVSKYDIIIPKWKDIQKMPNQGRNNWEQYLGSGYLHENDLRIMLSVLKKKYPEFVPYAKKYFESSKTILNNMFIMKKSIFNSYCEWLFDILFEVEKHIDYTDYSTEAIRTPGHLAERLLNIYCLYLKDKENYKFKELDTVLFLNTEPEVGIEPAFEVNNIAIALSANDYYVPYVCTLLYSMKESFHSHNNYDIVIMNRDFSEKSKRGLTSVFADVNNVSVRFINISKYEKEFESIFLRGHFALETYFRLLMPEILNKYDKVLYLDSDTIVKEDLAILYNEDITGYLLAGCKDPDTAGLYNGYEADKKEYMDSILKIRKPYEYFQAGVLLFNLEEFRKQFSVKQMLKFARSYNWQLLDQDVLNYLAQGRVKYVDMAWNVMTDWRGIRIKDIISRAPKYLSDAYAIAHSSPKIIHYAGPDKPWQQPDSDYAEEFWKYARKTIYYEVLIKRLAPQIVKDDAKWIDKARLSAINAVFPQNTKRRNMLDEAYIRYHNIHNKKK